MKPASMFWAFLSLILVSLPSAILQATGGETGLVDAVPTEDFFTALGARNLLEGPVYPPPSPPPSSPLPFNSPPPSPYPPSPYPPNPPLPSLPLPISPSPPLPFPPPPEQATAPTSNSSQPLEPIIVPAPPGVDVCTKDPMKALEATVTLSVSSLSSSALSSLESRLQTNLGSFFNLKNGLECPVAFTLSSSGRRLLQVSGTMTADLGSLTSISQVQSARAQVKAEANAGKFTETFIVGNQGSFTVGGETVTATSVSVDESYGFSTCDGSHSFGAGIVFNKSPSADVSLLRNGNATAQAELQSVDDQLARDMQNIVVQDVTDVVFNCPFKFAFTSSSSGKRALLGYQDGRLTIDMGSDVSKGTFTTAGAAVQRISFSGRVQATLNGDTYTVELNNWDSEATINKEFSAQGGSGGGSGSDAKVLGPAIAIPVFVFLVAVAGVIVFLMKRRKMMARYSTNGNNNNNNNNDDYDAQW